jgi:hypothetical protein
VRLTAAIPLLALLGCGPAAAPARPPASAPAPAPAAAPAPPARAPDLAGPVGLILGDAPDPAALLAKLEAAREHAPAAERALVDRLLRALRAVQRDRGPLAPAYLELLAVTRHLGRLYPRHFLTRLRVASTIAGAAASAEVLDLDGAALRAEALALARELVRDFPGEARAHGALGFALRLAADDPLATLRAYGRCLELDPAQATCRAAHQALVAEYERPHCTTADLRPDLAAHGGAEAPPGWPVTWEGRKLYLDPPAVLTRAHVAEVTLEGRDGTLELTPEGRRRFTAASASLARTGGWLVLRAGGRVLLAAKVMTPITGGRLRVAGVDLDALCARVRRAQVPPELRRAP